MTKLVSFRCLLLLASAVVSTHAFSFQTLRMNDAPKLEWFEEGGWFEPHPPTDPPPNYLLQTSESSLLPSDVRELQLGLINDGDAAIDLLKPLFNLETNVPADVVIGAVIAGASLSLLTGQDFALTTVAAAGAGYLATTPEGDVARVVGKAFWKSSSAAVVVCQQSSNLFVELCQEYEVDLFLKDATAKIVASTADAMSEGALFLQQTAANAYEQQQQNKAEKVV